MTYVLIGLLVVALCALAVGFARLVHRLDATERRDEPNALDVARAIEREAGTRPGSCEHGRRTRIPLRAFRGP